MGVVDTVTTAVEWMVFNLTTPTMVAFYRSLKFVYRLGLDVYSGLEDMEHVQLNSQGTIIPAKVFRPVRAYKKLPTVVVIHGLNASGYNDSRVDQLCMAIAGTGATAVSPHIVGLTTCEISEDRVHEVRMAVDAVAADKTINVRGERVAVVSACITAGFSLLASRYTESINGVLCIGAHASARHVLAHSCERNGLGGAMYAVESALLSTVARNDSELRELFHTSLKDDHLYLKDTPQEGLPKAIIKYPRAGKIYREMMGDWNSIEKALNVVYDEDVALWEAVSPIRHLKEMQCTSITMIHSASDGIVPPNESRILYHAIKKLRPDMAADVRITSLLDHGDKQTLGISAVPEALNLVKMFATFFFSIDR